MFPPVGVRQGGRFYDIDCSSKEALKLCLEVGQIDHAVLDTGLKLHQEIYVALFVEVLTNCGAEDRQPRDSPLPGDGSECVLVQSESRKVHARIVDRDRTDVNRWRMKAGR